MIGLWTALCCLFAFAAGASAAGVLSAGHSERAWVILEGPGPGAIEGGARLFHAPANVAAGTIYRAQTLPSMPTHVSAWGERLVMIYDNPADTDGAPALRSVRMVSVIANPATGVYIYRPADRQEALPSLPGEGALEGVVETSSGPIVMIRADDGARSLLRLTRGQWTPLTTPESAISNEVRLLAIGDGFGLLEPAPGPGAAGLARLWTIEQAAETAEAESAPIWRAEPTALRMDDASIVPVQSGEIAANPIEGGRLRFELVRGTKRHELAVVSEIPEPHAVFPIGDAVGIAWIDPADGERLSVAVVSAISGRLLHSGPTLREPLLHVQDIQMLSLLLGAVMLTVLIFVLKPEAASRVAVVLPPGTAMAPGVRRVLAAIIDLAPGLLVASRVWEMSVGEVVSLPWRVSGPQGLWPVIAVLAVFFTHSAISEWLFGRTIGKAATGCRTVSVTGQKPTLWQSASRNAVKALAPPVMLLALIDARKRHAGDIVSGTLVVSRVDEGGEKAGPRDDNADR